MPHVHVQLFGPFRVSVDGCAVPDQAWRGQGPRTLLQYLATRPEARATTDQLIEGLWGHMEPERARQNLQVVVTHLRAALRTAAPEAAPAALLPYARGTYQLPEGATVDFQALRRLLAEVRQGRQQEPAAVLRQLEQRTLPDPATLLLEQPYADWAEEAIAQARQDIAALRLIHADLLLQAHRPREALERLRQVLEQEPARESAAQLAMQTACDLGDRSAALEIFDRCRSALSEELGVDPMPDTLALQVRALQLDTEAAATVQAPERAPAAEVPEQPAPAERSDRSAAARPQHNLPGQLTSFVGRSQDLEQLKKLLTEHRLVSLVGAGGCGKTRLAIELGAALLDTFPHGIWLVELAPLREWPELLQATALATGLRENLSGSMTDRLIEHLAHRQALLLLDNCEHVLTQAAALAETLLRACPDLRILVTSRERLAVGGEVIWRISSLAVPDPERLPSLEEITRYDGVRLFAERARLSQPAFTLSAEHAATVAHICHRLDGIPMALELAAARLRTLPLSEIARRVDDRFHLLTGGSRTILPRHQTLRALVDWSYDLLAEPERVLWRRLAVFAGPFPLEAAEAVCGHGELEQISIFDLLCQLADKSLLIVEEQAGELRFRMLETMRAYGAERLRESGEEQVQGDRHRNWYAGLTKKLKPKLVGPEREECLRRLDLEHDNIQHALRWCRTQGDLETELRMLVNLSNSWAYRPLWMEPDRLDQLLRRPETAGYPQLLASLLQGAGRLACLRADHARAAAYFQESLRLKREERSVSGIASLLSSLAFLSLLQADYEMAAALLEEALAMGRWLAHGYPLIIRGMVWLYQGEADQAEGALEEALGLQQRLGDEATIAHALMNLGQVALCRGEEERGESLLQEAFARFERQGDTINMAWTLVNLGRAAAGPGRWAEAQERYRAALRLYGELAGSMMIGLPECLEGLARAAVASGAPLRAAQLLEAARGVRAATGMPLPPWLRQEVEEAERAAGALLDREPLGRQPSRGIALRLRDVIALAGG